MFRALGSVISCLHVLGHAGAHIAHDIKKIMGIVFNMPFPTHVGSISGLFEPLWPCLTVRSLKVHIVFIVYCIGIPNGSSGKEHGAAGDANGAVPCAHVIRACESGAFTQEAIEVGGVDVGFSMGCDGFKGHVVGKDKDEVGGMDGMALADGSGRE